MMDVIQVLLMHFIFFIYYDISFFSLESMVIYAVLRGLIHWSSEHVACEMDFFMLGTLTISSSLGVVWK